MGSQHCRCTKQVLAEVQVAEPRSESALRWLQAACAEVAHPCDSLKHTPAAVGAPRKHAEDRARAMAAAQDRGGQYVLLGDAAMTAGGGWGRPASIISAGFVMMLLMMFTLHGAASMDDGRAKVSQPAVKFIPGAGIPRMRMASSF